MDARRSDGGEDVELCREAREENREFRPKGRLDENLPAGADLRGEKTERG